MIWCEDFSEVCVGAAGCEPFVIADGGAVFDDV